MSKENSFSQRICVPIQQNTDTDFILASVAQSAACPTADHEVAGSHYENTPIQLYWKFHDQKLNVFR